MDLRIFTEPQQGATYDDLLAVARTSEELGFDAFFRSDHYLGMGSDGLPGPTDAWVTLAGLARDTSTIRLGTLVSAATFRLPGPLAIAVAGVQQMSGGRVELGLGAGWFAEEHTAYGIPFPPTAQRLDRLEEQLAVVTGLWRAEGRFSHDGAHYQLTDAPALPKPDPVPPVIVGGKGPRRTPALAARYADEFNTFQPPQECAAQFDRVRRACEAIDRDPATLVMSAAMTVCVGADESEVERRAKAIGRTSAQLRAGGLAGTPQEALDRLGEYAAVGATRAYLQVLDLGDLDHLRLLAGELLERL